MKKDWEIKEWDEILEIRSGRNQKEVLNPDGKYPILGSAGKIMGYADDFLCDAGTTIIGRKGTIDNPLYIETRFWNVDTAFGLIAGDDLDKRYLYYFCRSFDFKSLDKGTTLPSLVKKDLVKIQILLPPFPEQKCIVSILDKVFSVIERSRNNAEQNLKNAKELFESYLQGVFDPSTRSGQGGDDWVENRLDELTEVKDGTHDSPKYITDGIPFVTQKNIKSDGFNIEKTKYITEIDHQKFYKRSNVTYGDILISMIGANRGMSAIVDIKDTFSIKNVGLIKESESINQYFLLNYLQSTFAMKYVKSMSNGGAQEFIGLRALRAFPIPFPKSLKEQKQIVEKLDKLSAETKKLEAIYQQKIDDLEELKKSVLQKAFNGEL